jgi:hypothetical protein
MNRALQFAAAALLPMAALCSDQGAKVPVNPKPEGVVPKAGGNAGSVPKSNPGRIVDPANPVVRLFKATPEERERALEGATPEMKKNAHALLAWFDGLSPADKQIQIERAEDFAKLTAEERNTVRLKIGEWRELPKNEAAMVRTALLNLQRLPKEQRRKRMENPNFTSRFTPQQLDIIRALADVWFP